LGKQGRVGYEKNFLRFHLQTGNNFIGRNSDIEPNRYNYWYFAVFYYEPVAGGAYQALKWIDTEVTNGLLIHSIHDHAGNLLIAIALIQIVVMFLGRQFRTSWLTAWISGILLTLTAIGLSWTAMIRLERGGYWRFRIELSTIEAIPLIGSTLRDILTGGGPSTPQPNTSTPYTAICYPREPPCHCSFMESTEARKRNMAFVGMPSKVSYKSNQSRLRPS